MSLLPLIAIGFAGILVIILLKQRVFARKITAPSCPRCFYNVTGLLSNICPECGAKLNEAGVLQPGRIKPMGRLGWIAVWTCTIAPIALIATPLILAQIPPLMKLTGNRTFASPASRLYASVVIDGQSTFRAWNIPVAAHAQQLTLTLTRKDGSNSTMIADFDAMTCAYIDASGNRVHEHLAFDEDQAVQVVLDWYDVSGISIDQPQVQREAAEITDALGTHDQYRRSTYSGIRTPDYFGGVFENDNMSNFGTSNFSTAAAFQSTSGKTAMGPFNDPWPPRLIAGCWIALWLIGIASIYLFIGRAAYQGQIATSAIQSSPVVDGPSPC